ncbi:predicted protein [Micromonas commoda]|uniref:U3 small nucleolar RNA-associated protein 14 n=1 Tax=Micromonas commoda (strain RCC299 / NOUM17 / CCMP2709) TaxID=296587 RepID=C1ECZ3_MICCC|nr:predicted protein [Micromonas commoda]ACO65665.1 predicted protein [Micromonas commoda]|eukprot:XP_002504407.1 predicted protein [Micromonas commoda]
MLESESDEPEEARANGVADLSEEDDDDDEDGEEMDEEDDSEPASAEEEEEEDEEDEEDDEEEDEEDDEEDEEARAALVSDVVGVPRADKRRRLKRGITEHGREGEFALGPAVGSANETDLTDPGAPPGLSIASLMASVEGQGAAAAAIGSARRRLDRLANKKATPDAVPLPRVVNERIERKAAYETTKADIAKWQPIVKENREKPTLNFVGVERDKMHRKKTLASINTDFVPENDFEKEIMAHLKEANALTGEDVERAEDLALNELTPEEARERRARLAKMRNLLFKHEMKAKRVKAIKSKTFHRHNRKTGAMKVIDGETGEEIGDDDAALEGLDPDNSVEAKREYLRAQERMLLKHKNTSRWAKRAIKKGLAHLPGTKEAIAEQLRIGQELKRKIGIGGERGASRDDDDDEYSTDAETDSDDDAPGVVGGGAGAGDVNDRRRALAKAKLRTMQAIEEGAAGAEEEGGLFALPFMARHMKKKREEAEEEAKQLLRDIERAEREAAAGAGGSDDDEGFGGGLGDGDWGKGAEKFEETDDGVGQRRSRIVSFGGGVTAGGGGPSGNAKPKRPPREDGSDSENDGGPRELGDDVDDDDEDAAIDRNETKMKRGANRAARRAAAAGEAGDPLAAAQVPEVSGPATHPAATVTVHQSEVKELTAAAKKSGSALKARMAARASGRGAVVVTAGPKPADRKIDMAMDRDDDDDDDAKNHPASNGVADLNQRDLLSRAFAGDDVVGEFEADKNAEVTDELPKVDVPKQMPGWGGWADVQAKRGPPKWQLEAERKARATQQKALKARRDANLKHVVISERYDKKVAGFNVEHVPHGFDSKAVYEGSMRTPLGPDANTDKSFRDLTRPKVLVNAGAVIRPMTFPKGRRPKQKE